MIVDGIPPHDWSRHPGIVTTRVDCLLCEDPAVVVCYFPNGCTCSPNRVQARCMQHLIRASDTEEDFAILEDFRIPVPRKGHSS